MFLEEYTYENALEAEREAGREERNMEIACNMKKANESIDKIILFTGFSPDEVEKL